MTDHINTIDVLIIICAIIFLVGWIAWVIRLIIIGSKLKKRNAFLYKRYEELQVERRKSDMYESLLDSYHLNSDDTAGLQDQRRIFRNLENQVRQTRMYKNPKVGINELAELVGMDRKMFEIMFKDASPIPELSDWIDSIRLNEAISLLKEMKASGNGEQDAEIAQIAVDCGFVNRRAMNGACRKIIGIGIVEMLHHIK